MPFELGICIGAKHLGSDHHRHKRTLILDREPYRYRQFFSDIAGLDPEHHNDNPFEAITRLPN